MTDALGKIGTVKPDETFPILKEWAKDEKQVGQTVCRIAAANLNRGRVLELVESCGIEVLFAAFDEIISYGKRRMRKKLKAIPEGDALIVETSVGLQSFCSEEIGFEKWVEDQAQKAMEYYEIHLQKVAALKP